ncbi:MAG: amino acid adenylation domain-containing protein [Myxococcales bacterium]|nr:amino acid adenylation domain-containing protein [Myxococcales bacterium]
MKVSGLFESLTLSAEEDALWLLHELDPKDTTYHVAGALRVVGPIDVGLLTAAWEHVARRHLALSTAIREVSGVRTRVAAEKPIEITVTNGSNLNESLHELTEAPFDLAKGPLLRVLLANEEFSTVIAACAHHIAVDLHSIVVLIREVEQAYLQLVARGEVSMPAPRAQHHDYVVAQRERQSRATAALPARAEVLRLHPLQTGSTIRPLPAGVPLARRIHRTVCAHYRRALIDQSKEISVTPYAWILAAAQTLIGRLERIDHFSAVTPTTGRRSTAMLEAVGYYVNLVPVPCELDRAQSFADAAVGSSRRAKEAFAARELPFPLLVAAAGGAAATSPRPGIAVTYERPSDRRFNALIGGAAGREFSYMDCPAQVVDLARPAPQADLAIAVIDDGEQLQVCFDVDRRIYDDAHGDAVADGFVALLEATLRNRELAVGALPLLDDRGRAAVLALGHEEAPASRTTHETLHAGVLAAAAKFPQVVAVAHHGRSLTYRELVAQASLVAAALQRRGVTVGTPVAVWMDPGVDLVVSALAILLAGGVYMPVDPSLPIARVTRMLADAEPALVLVDSERDTQGRATARLGELQEADGLPAPDTLRGDAAAYLIFTSGSTGRPKGVLCTHQGACNLLDEFRRLAPIPAGQGASAFCSIAFDVSIYELFSALSAGATLRFVPAEVRADAEALVTWLRDESIASAFVPAMALPTLLGVAQKRRLSLRRLLVGVEPIPQSLLRALSVACPDMVIVNGYGPTETAICATLWVDRGAPVAEGRPAPIGRPVPGTGAYLIDAGGELVPAGSVGELVLTGRGLAHGYIGDADLTARRFITFAGTGASQRAYLTGDLARWNPDRTITFVGRADGQLKLRGHRIERGEIETVIREQPGVIECYVNVWNDVPGGRLVAHLAAVDPAAVAAARARAAELLPAYMVPSQWVQVEALPRGSSGKVDPSRLEIPRRAESIAEPADPLTEAVASQFAEVLGLSVSADDDFFALGGHSLLASQLVARLRSRHSVELPLASLWQAPTPRGMATRIAGAAPLQPQDAAGTPNRSSWPLTPAQRRMWMHEQLTPGTRAYLMTDAIRIGGLLDVERLRGALAQVVERHATLRSAIRARGDELLAVVQFAPAVELPVVELSEVAMVEELVNQVAGPAFDLTNGPLFRFALAHLADDDHVLVTCVHHIACDGWSLGVLARDVFALYANTALWPLTVGYGDLAVRQHAADTAEQQAKAVEHWRPRLTDLPTVELGRDGVSSREQAVRAQATIGNDVLARLAPVARQTQSTPFMALVAVVQLWLSRISGSQDIVVGAPFADRASPESEQIVGLLLDTLVLRSKVSGGASFLDLLAAARDEVVSSLDFRAAPIEQIMAELESRTRSPGAAPFDVLVNFISVPPLAAQVGGLELVRLDPVVTAPKFPLTIYAVATEAGLDLQLVAQGDAFSQARLEAAGRQLVCLLDQLTAHPQRACDEATMISAADAAVVPDPSAPLALEAVGFVHERVLSHPADAIALRWGQRQWTYGELAARSALVAANLAATGLPQGTSVGIHSSRCPGAIVAMLGVLRAGYVMVMIDESLPIKRRERLCEGAQVRVALAVASEPLAVDGVRWLSLNNEGELLAPITTAAEFPAVSDPDAPAYVFFTSGTTGQPKPVLGTQRGLAHFVGWQVERFQIAAGDRAAHLTSLGFDVVLRDVLTPLSGGATLCIPEGTLDPSTLLPWLDEQRVTLMHTVPTLLNWWLDHGDSRLGLTSLRWIFSAGEALHASLVQRWQRTFPRAQTRFVNIYGPTETTMAKMYNVIENVVAGNQPVGRPLPQTQALVLRDGRVRCGIGEVGEIWIRTPYRTRGYLNDREATAAKFLPNPFTQDAGDLVYSTGDLGRYRPDGLLEVLGRVDHQVKIGGVRIEPDEIAGVLTRMPGIRRAAVVAMARPDGQKALVAYIVGDGSVALGAEKLTSAVAAELPAAMIPSRFLFVDDLPTNANGKLDRRALPEPDWTNAGASAAAPTTETERQVAAIWTELLGGREVGIHDNFFASGGHSLLAMRLIARVAAALGVEVSLRDLFDEPTIAAMSRLVDRGAASPAAHAPAPVQDAAAIALLRDAPLTELQAAYLFGRRTDVAMGGVPTHGYAEIDMPGLDLPALQRALNLVVERHDALRLRFFDDRQELASSVDTLIVEHDWRELSQAAQAERLAAVRQEMVGTPLPADRAPLIRLAVSRGMTADGALVERVHVVFDALIVDAGSSRIVATELLDAYHGRPLAPAPAPGRFLSYVRGLADAESCAELAEARQYWMDRLATLPDGPELPLAVDVGSISGAQFHRTTAFLAPDVWHQFRDRAAAAGVTPTSALLATYAQIVSHYARRPQFCVNVTTSRRPGHPADAGVLGNFTSLLLVAVDGAAGGSVAQQLRAVHTQLWRDLSASAFSGVRVMREIARTGRPPAMPVVFTSALGDGGGGSLPEPSYGVTRSSQVVLNHGVSELDGGLQLRWDVVEEAFRPGVAEEMLRLLHATLVSLSHLDWTAVRFEELVGRAAKDFDRAHNLTDGTRPTQTLHQSIVEICETYPDWTAIVGPGVDLSYRALRERAGAVATWVRTLSAKPGDRVVLLMKKGWEQAVAVLGVLGCRCAYVPVDPSQPVARILEIFEQIQPVGVLTQAKFLGHGALHDLPHHAVDTLEPLADVELLSGELEDLAYVIFTSGSTGRPKGVAIDNRGAANTVIDINERYGVTAADRTLAISSLSFDLSVYDLLGFLSIGGAVVVPDCERERDAEHLAECAATYGVTVWNSVPAFLEMVVEQTADRPEQLASVRLAMLSGDWIPLRLVERTRTLQPQITLMSLGGATEASIWSNDFPIGDIGADWKSVPYGRPLRNQTMHVLDSAGRPRPAWAVGELFIGGIGVALGYWGDEQRTQERFIDHPELGRIYRTGDLGRRWRDGIIELLGRDDLQVKIRGHRIELGEVEAALRGGPGVKEAVCAVRGERGGHLVAYVMRDGSGGEAEAITAILAHVAARVPEYMVPSRVMFIESLPLSSNGKVDRRRLPEPAAEHHGGGAAPSTDAERALAVIWCEVLRVPEVVTSDDFLSLGGDSIRAVQVVARARRQGLHLEVRALLERRSLGELAARAGLAVSEAVVLADVASAPLTPIQRWFMQQEFAEQDHWNQSVAVDLDPAVNVDELERAMRALEQRHAGLRLRFSRSGGTWRQAAAPAETPTVTLARLSVATMTPEAARLASSMHADRLHRSLDLEHGPVWGALLIEGGAEAQQRLVVVAHHLVVDGVSWRVMLEDFDALLRGAEPLPQTTGFPAWAERRTAALAEQRAAAEAALAETESWPWASVRPLPVDHEASTNQVSSAARALVRLDVATTGKLLERSAVRRDANVEAILMAAVGKALRRWTGDEAFAIYLESHGRDAAEPLGVEVSRTVGWFTRLTPVVIEVGDDSLDETIDDVAAQLRARRLGALAEELWHADHGGLDRHIPEISFDYLGHADGVLPAGARLRWAGQAPGTTRSPSGTRRDLLEVIAHVGNGQLEVAITYGDRHKPSTIQSLAASIERELRSLTASRLDLADSDHVVDRYPLAPLQELMLEGASRRAGTYHVQWVMPIVGELDTNAMGRAWQKMVQRHAILRTALRDSDGQARQVELAAAEAAVTVYDGRESAEDLAALVLHDRSTPFDLEVPPLARLTLVLGPEQRHYIVFSHHHAILDGWSEPRLFTELFASYEAERTGRALTLPAVPSQRGFVDWLYSHSEPTTGRDTVARSARRAVPSLTRGEDPAGVVTAALSAETLTRAARRFRVTPSAVASTAWAVALGAGRGEVAIGLASSVRPAEVPEIETILGCFLNVAPLSFDRLAKLPLEEALAEVQSRQLHSLDRAHLPLTESCRADSIPVGAIESVLRFQSYEFSVPLPDSLRSWRGLSHLDRGDFEAFDVWHFPLNLVIIPERELTIQLDFDPARVQPAQAQRLVRRLCAALTALADATGTLASLDAIIAHQAGERVAVSSGAFHAGTSLTLGTELRGPKED